jgi:hypothetical protein
MTSKQIDTFIPVKEDAYWAGDDIYGEYRTGYMHAVEKFVASLSKIANIGEKFIISVSFDEITVTRINEGDTQ